ncbi:MAG: arylsulfatase [Gemmataceae bacterium]|nr:arylsulfatase [Gemmata sp.]MDW8198182.1 arylsulfatase [Gemmataceae bacterium]
MKRWAFLGALLALFLLAPAGRAQDKPNIVFFLADDLGREDCGFMGGRDIRTPHIDKLAAAGAILDAFYVQPLCTPTRAALMTGRYPMRHGLQVGVVRPWARYGLPLEERTLAQALQEAGYVTAIIGKWHLGHHAPEYLPTRRGFDYQYGHYNGAIDYFTHRRDGGLDWHKNDRACHDEGYSTHLIAQEAVKFVHDHAGKKPFFLYVPFNAVHTPLQVPEKYLKPYAHLPEQRRTLAGMLAAMDEAIGQIVEAVEKAGVRKKTLFIFSSDNGGFQPGVVTNNGRYRAGKGTLYEGGVRVCAFATWDGHIPAGRTITEPLHMVDWYPTLVKLAGASREQKLPLDGRDIWPTLTAGKPSPHDAILLNTTPNTGAVRVGDWKLVVIRGPEDPDGNPMPKKKDVQPRVELFNLKDDPYEKKNLADENTEKVEQLKKVLAAFAQEALPPKAHPKPADFQAPKVWGEKD